MERREYFYLLLVLSACLLVRFWCLAELRSNTYLGNIRVSDAKQYHEMATAILSGELDPSKPFWQAPLYPFLLAVFYHVCGSSLATVQVFHILLGGLNCLLLYRVTRKLFGAQVALIAAGLMAFYLPAILFDTQALAVNVTVGLNLLVLFYVNRFTATGRRVFLVTGAFCLGAAIISHGLSLFVIPVIVFWLARAHVKGPLRARQAVVLFVIVVSIAPAVVSIRNYRAGKEFVFISSNSGINLYVGNHPAFEKKFSIRNGVEWRALRLESVAAGAYTAAERNRYFVSQTLQNVWNAPLGVLRTMLQKVILSVSGDEISRNFPIFPLRDFSRVVALLYWQIGWSDFPLLIFPSGLLLPISFIGVILAGIAAFRKRELFSDRLLPAWIAVAYWGGMVLFFPCTRYRLPAVWLLAPYGAYALARTGTWITAYRRGEKSTDRTIPLRWVGAFVLLALFSNLVGPMSAPRAPENELAEHLLFQGAWHVVAGRKAGDRARVKAGNQLYHQAAAIDPDYLQALHNLGYVYLNSEGQIPIAQEYFRKVMNRLPDNSPLRPVYRDFIAKLEPETDDPAK